MLAKFLGVPNAHGAYIGTLGLMECHWKALILTIPMYCVKKSNPMKIREKRVFCSL